MNIFKRTVAGVLARFHKIIAELEQIEQEALAAIERRKAAVDKHTAAILDHAQEAAQARKVADNIKALVS